MTKQLSDMKLDASLPNSDLTRVPKVAVALSHEVNHFMGGRFTFYNTTTMKRVHAKDVILNLQ